MCSHFCVHARWRRGAPAGPPDAMPLAHPAASRLDHFTGLQSKRSGHLLAYVHEKVCFKKHIGGGQFPINPGQCASVSFDWGFWLPHVGERIFGPCHLGHSMSKKTKMDIANYFWLDHCV